MASENSNIIQIVARHLFDKKFTDEELPSSSSALNFMNEAHILAKQQATESLLESQHFTFGQDATSRQKKHYLEKHVYLNDGPLKKRSCRNPKTCPMTNLTGERLFGLRHVEEAQLITTSPQYSSNVESQSNISMDAEEEEQQKQTEAGC